MIMTMEAEYRKQGELFPAPERLEKVQDHLWFCVLSVSELHVTSGRYYLQGMVGDCM